MALTTDDVAALKRAAEVAIGYRLTDHDRPIRPELNGADILERFAGPLPETGMPTDAVIAALADAADPGLLVDTNPRFHGWVMGASHPAGVAADWLTSAWGQVASFFDISPAGGAAEQVATGWLLDLLGLPSGSGMGLATGATMANFTAMVAARTALLDRAGWDVEAKGLFAAPEVNVVLGGEAHSSVYLTLRLMGFGSDRVHVAASDDQGRMLPDALAQTLAPLKGPILVCLQAGNVNSGAFDPFAKLIPIAREKDAWIHVDGAFGLWAAAAPSMHGLTDGLAKADSWAADAHKWLQVPYDCGIAVVRDPQPLVRSMGSSAAYLPDASKRNPADYAPELSRRARGIAVWAVLKALGRQGVIEMVERHCAIARRIAERLDDEPGLEILNDVVLNQVVVAAETDALTKAILAETQAEGTAYPSAGQWKGRDIIRVSVSSGPAQMEDADITVDAICRATRKLRAG